MTLTRVNRAEAINPQHHARWADMRTKRTCRFRVLYCNMLPSNFTDLSRNLANMSTISATASAPDIDMREALCKFGHLSAEFFGVTVFEMPELTEI